MFNKEMQCLVEVRPLREVFNLSNGNATQEWRVANTNKVMTTHYTAATDEEPEAFDGEMYRTFEDYEKGKKMPIEELFYSKDPERHICQCLLKDNRCINTDEKGAYFWTIENGEAVKWYFRDHMTEVRWEYNEKGQITVKSDYEGGELPEAYWSREDVFKYNDYRFVDADGHEEQREGVYNRLRLEPDQEKLAAKLQKVLNECEKAGIKVYFNTTNYDLRAVNKRKLEEIGYGPNCDDETEQAFVFEDDRVAYVFKGVSDMNTEDSDERFVIKKKQQEVAKG